MRPALIYDLLSTDATLAGLGITSDAVIESQSLDNRPDKDYFVTIHFDENQGGPAQILGPRTMVISVHHPWDKGRDYNPLTGILNRIDQIILPIDNQVGSDGVLVTQVRRGAPRRSGNMEDEAYKTIVRWATYGVSYDEFAS